MRSPLLRLWLALLGCSVSCVGGPVSDWPGKSHDSPNGGGIPGAPDDDTEDSVRPRSPADRPGSQSGGGRMDGGVTSPQPVGSDAPDAGADDAAVPCAADTGACADPCEAEWQRAREGDDDFAAGSFVRVDCDEAKLSDP